MRDIQNFYDESQTKSRTRHSIIKTALNLFSKKGIESVAISEIATLSEITSRNLYRYYPTKEFLIIDCAYMAFYISNKNGEEPYNSGISGIENLKVIMNQLVKIGETKEEQLNFTRFIMYFDIFIATLSKDNTAFIKYTTEYVPLINHMDRPRVLTALKMGIDDKTITIKKDEITLYNDYILQSLFALNMRIAIKEYENSSINRSLMQKHIDIILNHIGVQSEK